MSQPPPGWKVPKPKPPWGYRKTPPSIKGPSPDYTAEAEAHREELRHRVVEPIIVKPQEVSHYIPFVYDPNVDVDGVPTKYTYTEEERERARKAWRDYEGLFRKVEDPFLMRAVKLEAKAKEKAKEGKPWEGMGAYMGAMGSYAVADIITGVTAPVRPVVIGETASSVYRLATSAKARKDVYEYIMEDPFRTTVRVGAGFAGGYISGKVISKIGAKLTEAEAKRIPSEDFLISDPDTRLLEFPETVDLQKTTFKGFEKKYVRISDDLVSAEVPYVGRLPDDIPVTKTTTTKVPTSERVLWEMKGGRAMIPIDQKPLRIPTDKVVTEMLKTKKGMLYKLGKEYGLVRTGEGLEAALLPEYMGELVEVSKPIPFIETLQGHLPGLAKPTIPIIVKPSAVTPLVLGVGGGLAHRTPVEERILKDMKAKPSPGLELYDKPDFVPVLDPGVREMIKPVSTTRRRERVDPGYTIPPAEIEREMERVLPGYRQRVGGRRRSKTLEEEIQKSVFGMASEIRRYQEDYLKPDFRMPPPKRKAKRRGPSRYEEVWGEHRKYPIGGIVDYLKGFFVEPKPSRKAERERKNFFKRTLGLFR